MSRYRIEVARQAEKAILKLPPQVQRRVRDAVRALADEPRPRGARQLEVGKTPGASASATTG